MRDILAVIPARYRSSRLPGKPLVDIAGKPMIVRTWERCAGVVDPENVVVATDDRRIADVCAEHGIWAEMTRDDHPTGGDRVHEISTRIPAHTYVNVQGDEPVMNRNDLRALIAAAREDRDAVLTGYCPMPESQWRDSKYIKLLFGHDKNLIYIGRAQVPGSHSGQYTFAYRPVCLYADSRQSLELFASVEGRTRIEAVEDHEIMRFLEMDHPVRVVEMSDQSMPVDRPLDVELVEAYLAEHGGEAPDAPVTPPAAAQ